MTSFGPYPATCLKIHDGDTITTAIDLGFGLTETLPARFNGINAPELATPAGTAALAYLATILHVGDRITVVSHGWDKYRGRYDADITLADGTDLNQLMLTSGHAVPMPAGHAALMRIAAAADAAARAGEQAQSATQQLADTIRRLNSDADPKG